MRFLLSFFIISNLFNTASQAQEKEYYFNVGCDDVSKIDLLIRKGIMTKNLCLTANKTKLELILQGNSYALGQYLPNPELTNYYQGTTKLSCKDQSFQNEDAEFKKEYFKKMLNKITNRSQIATNNFPEKEFKNLALFLKYYTKRVNEIMKLSDEASIDSKNITIKAYGYADGVRNTDETYDSYVLNRLCNDKDLAEGKRSNLYDLIKQNIPAANSPYEFFKSAKNSDEKAFERSKIRNVYLAKMRADNLSNKIKGIVEPSIDPGLGIKGVVKEPSYAEISEGEGKLNPSFKNNCVGYCQMRRGAKVEINIPGIQNDLDPVDPVYNSISAYFNSPYSQDQLTMNKFAIKRLVEDYGKWLFDNSNENSDVIKKAKEKEITEMKNIYSAKKDKDHKGPIDYNYRPIRAKTYCADSSLSFKECADKKSEILASKEYINKKKFIDMVKFALLNTNGYSSSVDTLHPTLVYKKGLTESIPANNLGKLPLTLNIAEILDHYDQIAYTYYFASLEANSLKPHSYPSNKYKTEVKKFKASPDYAIGDEITDNRLNLILWGNHQPDDYNDSFYNELKSNYTIEFGTGELSYKSLSKEFADFFDPESAGLGKKSKQIAEDLARRSISTDERLKVPGIAFKYYKAYKCQKLYFLGQKGAHPDYCKNIHQSLDENEMTLEHMADLDFTDESILDISAIAYYPLKIDTAGVESSFKKSKLDLRIASINTAHRKLEDLANYPRHMSGASIYFHNAESMVQNFWDNYVELPASATTHFLRDRLNIPSDGNLKISNPMAKVNKTVNFDKHFKPLIDWTTIIIRSSIGEFNAGSGVLKPKKLMALDFNSEDKGIGKKAEIGKYIKGQYDYPFIILPKSLHQRIISDYYASAYISAQSNFMYASIYRKYGSVIDYFKENYTKKTHGADLGKVNKSTYESYKTIIDNKLEEYEIKGVKTKPWPAKIEIDEISFVGRNWKAITALMSYHLLKAQKIAKEPKKNQLEPLDIIRPSFIDEFAKGTKYILDHLHLANKYLLIAHIHHSPEPPKKEDKSNSYPHTFSGIAEATGGGGPSPSIMGAQVSTIFSFADYIGAYTDILNQLSQAHLGPGRAEKKSVADWVKWRNYRGMLKSVPKDLKYVYYRPTDIHIRGDKDVHGFLHTACHTGVLFPEFYNDKQNDRFHYQSRYRTPRWNYYRDYPSKQAYRAPYDDSFYLPQIKGLSFAPLDLVRVKNPTAYLIKGDGDCSKCSCLKTGTLTEEKLREYLDNSIELSFTNGYDWVNGPEKRYAEKRFVIGTKPKSAKGKLYTPLARNYTLNKSTNFTSDLEDSEKYCLFSPIVPQSHEVGTGASDIQEDEIHLAKQIEEIGACPFTDALVGVEANKLAGTSMIAGLPDVPGMTEDEFLDIKATCGSAMQAFPMGINTCNETISKVENPNVYDACSFMPQSIAKLYGTKDPNSGLYKCYVNGISDLTAGNFGQKDIPLLKGGAPMGKNYDAYLCDAITKIYKETDEIEKVDDKEYKKGYMIWTSNMENDPKVK